MTELAETFTAHTLTALRYDIAPLAARTGPTTDAWRTIDATLERAQKEREFFDGQPGRILRPDRP